jgi:hypothetical protein
MPRGVRGSINDNPIIVDYFYKQNMGSTIFYKNILTTGTLRSIDDSAHTNNAHTFQIKNGTAQELFKFFRVSE